MFRLTIGTFTIQKNCLEISQKTDCHKLELNRLISTTNNAQKYVGRLCKKFAFLDWFMTGPRGKIKDIESESESDCICRKSIKIKQHFRLHGLEEGPERYTNVTTDEAKLYYRQLQTIRHIEKASEKLFEDSAIGGSCQLSTGQEACAVGMRAAMRPNDNIITAHRCHGWSYLMGVSPFGVLAELIGKQGGCARGKGGSAHMYAPQFYGGNGIQGAQVPIGAGLALASKLKRDGGACLAVYGDSAANKGQVHESYNIAKMWKLPCVFVCENNLTGFPGCNSTSYYSRCGDIPGIWVDGSDVLAVRQATEYALDYATEKGPMVLELNTSMYAMSPEMRTVIQSQRDPVTLFRRQCVENHLITTAEIRSIDKSVRRIVEQAARDAKDDKEVPLEELTADVYAEYFEPKIRSALGLNMRHANIARAHNNKRSAKRGSVILKARGNRAKKHAEQAVMLQNLDLAKVGS